ncbi:MAG: hypothetical protein PVG39_29720, partial [Desulfobacteraceae bacterium]
DIGFIDGKWNIKNNSNTNLQEVLDGKTVFACDLERDSNGNFVIEDGKYVAQTGVNHKGVSTGDNNYDKEVDFIQELVNQVVPRKQTLNAAYELMAEDGYFGATTADSIGMFKSNFGNDNVTSNGEIFQKIIKDYSLESNPGFWKDKIVDKYVLAGQTLRTDPDNNPDNLINNSTGNTVNDTGLYELYDNVVRIFVDAMIEEAKNYAGIGTGTLPTDNWYARTGEGPIGTANPGEHKDGMSYCFGGKQNIEEFNNSVASCSNTPPRSTLTSFNLYTIVNGQCNGPINYNLIDYASPSDAVLYDDPNVTNDTYQGNLNDGQTGCPFTGEKNYPGLYAQEYYSLSFGNGNYYEKCNNDVGSDPWPANIFPQFNTAYWSGIDCSGLVQWSVEEGKTTVEGVNITIPSPPAWRTSQGLFTENNYNNVYYKANPTEPAESLKLKNKLKKGDLVRYGGHISIVYSEDAMQVGNQVRYQIIHAYGSRLYTYPSYDPVNPNSTFFSRKVILTWQNISSNPTGFGRIKLWE